MRFTSGVGEAGWRLYHCAAAVSTNDLARELPAWCAVRADVQTGGRGRFGRVFVSDSGGLWISAVLPAEGGPEKWAGFSLMVGVHLVMMLEALQIPGTRLRWPNDLMSGQKKLGGLLIEQSARDMLIVGFGLNVRNAPWDQEPDLEPIATSLAMLANHIPSPDVLAVRILDALADAHRAMLAGGMESAIDALNRRWIDPVAVDLLLSDGDHVLGRFMGLDQRGNLRLSDEFNHSFIVEHQRIEKLVEISCASLIHQNTINHKNPNGTQ